MSNLPKGPNGPPPRLPPKRNRPPAPQAVPETRAERRYPVGARQLPVAEDGWTDANSAYAGAQRGDATGGHVQPYDEMDPRTGPATFEFQPSPLQPRQAHWSEPSSASQAPVHGAHAAGRNRIPQSPDELIGDDDMAEPVAGRAAPPPEPDFGRLSADPANEPNPARERTILSAPTRMQRSQRELANAPIVPAGSVTGRSLTLVVAIMCFLASLTTGAVYLMNQSASAWLRDIAGEVTVQVEARDKIDVERQVRDVADFLGKQPGIIVAKPLSLEASAGLLEPWLGQSDGLKNLPVPRMIAVEIDRVSPPDFTALRAGLMQQFKGTTLDDHRHWQQQIRTVTRSFALGGIAILILVSAATMAIIVSATRSALASNREIVEVLHFVGATDRFIAGQFQKHFLSLGIRAGFFGATLAALVFLGMPVAMDLLGGGTATLTEMQHLVGAGVLDLPGYGWLLAVVVVISALCMMTSRIGVYRILHTQH